MVQSSETDTISDDEKPLTEKERAIQRAKSALMSNLSEAQRINPSMQKVFEVLDLPEFLDLLEKDLTERQWNDFMESQGFEGVRDYSGLLSKFVPDIELADYEPVVRRKFAELFIAAEPVDLTDPTAAAEQRSSVFLELGRELAQTDMAAAAWFMEKFGEDRDGAFRWQGVESNPAFIWMSAVQQNAASIVAAAETAGVDTPETQESAQSWDLSSVVESPPASPDTTSEDRPSMAAPLPAVAERPTNPNTAPRASATPVPGLTDVPKTPTGLPTVEGLEASLKEQFTPERFERAMSTLERYGPEEGLRRLRENDPEVAKQVERVRHRNRQEDAQ